VDSSQSPEKTPLFDAIDLPADLKKLSPEQLPQVCAEIRQIILDTVSVTGGHLGSGMGVVELTVALHYVFDFETDRLLMDVGHQSYPHKLLTGRKGRFHTLRQKGGLSGFTNRFESSFDVYNCGHAGTASSAALGISHGDHIAGNDRHIVAIVGDAAMGCGVAFEALNHAGGNDKERVLIILNDNRWSIAETVGALTRYLSKIRTGPLYTQARKKLHNILRAIPIGGKYIDEQLDHGLDAVRHVIQPGHMFEALGINYYGPVDGHDTCDLLDMLGRVKDRGGVTILHVRTEKGRGVPGSQDRYDRAHAAKPKPKKMPVEPDMVVPARPRRPGRAWTAWFSEGIQELAESDKRVVAITAAMPDGTGLMDFREKFPDRFVDAGIAEQHAVAFSSGLAIAGLRPIAAIYSTFLQRGYDQVFQEVALQNLPVMFAIDRAGLVGEDGYSHHGLFDIAFLRTFPNMTLMAPKDGPELKAMLKFGITLDGPSAIRYARGNAAGLGDLVVEGAKSEPIELGRMEILREGSDGAILAYGNMVETAVNAADILRGKNIHIEVINGRFAKPLDREGILALADRHDSVFTLEDHALMGGFGSAVLELIAAEGPVRAHFKCIGVPDRFIPHATPREIYQELGLDAPSVAARFTSESPSPV
jgi:1-deoxy-D-xylulose-5-phosphate synthase